MARFTNRQFQSTTKFNGCTFAKAPEFHGCTLHQDTQFPGPDSFKDTASEDAAQAYRTLKLAMEAVRSRDEEGMFYALEQKSKRRTGQMDKAASVPSWLYEQTADYGQSFLRPLVFLFLMTIAFFLFYSYLATPTINFSLPIDGPQLIANLAFTLEQLVSPFRIWQAKEATALSTAIPWTTAWPVAVKLLTLVQSIISAVCIALFLLAVRWRFRRG